MQANPAPTYDRKLNLTMAAIIVAILLLTAVLSLLREKQGESILYRNTVSQVLSGEQIYVEQYGAFTYPPFMVTLYMPFSLLPEPFDRWAWQLASVAAGMAVAWMVWRMASAGLRVMQRKPDDETLVSDDVEKDTETSSPTGNMSIYARLRPPIWVAWVWIGLIVGRLITVPVGYQSHDLFIALFIMLTIWCWATGRDIQAGIWAGIGAACKATPLLFLPVFLWQMRFKAAAALVLTLTVATFLPDLFSTNPTGKTWFGSWYDLVLSKVDPVSSADLGPIWNGAGHTSNQSLSSTVTRIMQQKVFHDIANTPNAKPEMLAQGIAERTRIAKKLVTLLKLLTLCWICYVCWPLRYRHLRQEPQSDENRERYLFCMLGQGSVVICGMLLLSPMANNYHFATLLAPVTMAVVYFLYGPRGRHRNWLIGLVLVAMVVGMGVVGKDLIGREMQSVLLTYGNLTWGTVAVMLISGAIAVRESTARSSR